MLYENEISLPEESEMKKESETEEPVYEWVGVESFISRLSPVLINTYYTNVSKSQLC